MRKRRKEKEKYVCVCAREKSIPPTKQPHKTPRNTQRRSPTHPSAVNSTCHQTFRCAFPSPHLLHIPLSYVRERERGSRVHPEIGWPRLKTGRAGGRTGQDRTGQDRTGQDRTGQDRAVLDRTGQDRAGQDRTGHSNPPRMQQSQNLASSPDCRAECKPLRDTRDAQSPKVIKTCFFCFGEDMNREKIKTE